MASTDAPITVGILFSQTGLTAVVERTQRQAALVAIDEINAAGGVLGRELVGLDADPASDPRRFGQEAARLLDGGAETIFGCYMSSTRRAVLPIIEQRGATLFYPTLYEGFEFSPNCVYSGAAPNQNCVGLADYLVEHYGGRFYFVGSNYVFPYETNRIMRDLIQNRGGRVVEERYVPMQPSDDDIARLIGEIRRHAPVVVFSTIVGDAATLFYRAYERAGFDRGAMPVGSLTTGEPELMAMGGEAAAGHITSAPYFASLASPENARFLAAYRARQGAEAPVSACTEAAYFQVHLFAEAVRRAGATDRAAVLAMLPAVSFDAPQGPVRVDSRTHHTWLWPRVGRATDRCGFELLIESPQPVRPDPYLIEPEPLSWAEPSAAQ